MLYISIARMLYNLLLSQGADYASWNSNGNSIFHEAAIAGSLNTIDILLAAKLQQVDPDAKNRQGLTALELAQQRETKPDGFVHKVRLLLVDVCSRNARTALGIYDDSKDLPTDGIPSVSLRNPRNQTRAQVHGPYHPRRFTQRVRLLLLEVKRDLPRRLDFAIHRWKTFLLAQLRSFLSTRAISLGLRLAALILWIYLVSRMRWVRLILEMGWNLLGPDDFEL